MTSKIIVNTIEADTGISSVTFASNINLQNDSSILVSSSGIRLGTGSTIAAPSANEITLSTNSAERLRITNNGTVHTAMTGTAPTWLGNTMACREKFSVFQGANFGEACFNIDVDNANSFLSHNMYYDGGWKIRKSGSPVRHLEIGTNGWTFMTGADGADDTTSALTQRLRIDSSGNLGVNKTPETDWSSSYRAIEIGNSSISAYQGNTYPSIELNMNCRGTQGSYSAGWKYIRPMVATQIHMPYDGNVLFRRAASGSADGAITWSESMRITSAGHVLRPTMAAAAVTISADQTTLSTFNTSYQSLVLNSEGFDNANNYNTTNYRFTAPETGFYNIGCNVQLENGSRSAGGNRWMYIYPLINGATQAFTSTGNNEADFDPADTHYYSWNWSSIIKLSQNDYVEWKYKGNLDSILIRGQRQSVFYFYQVG